VRSWDVKRPVNGNVVDEGQVGMIEDGGHRATAGTPGALPCRGTPGALDALKAR